MALDGGPLGLVAAILFLEQVQQNVLVNLVRRGKEELPQATELGAELLITVDRDHIGHYLFICIVQLSHVALRFSGCNSLYNVSSSFLGLCVNPL